MISTSIVTVGFLTSHLQATPARISAAAQMAGVKPIIVVNGSRVYFRETDVAKIRAALTGKFIGKPRA